MAKSLAIERFSRAIVHFPDQSGSLTSRILMQKLVRYHSKCLVAQHMQVEVDCIGQLTEQCEAVAIL